MNPSRNGRRHLRRTLAPLAFAAFLAMCAIAVAAPGAHGPDGEHLDAAPSTDAGTAAAYPRFVAQSETFELVGRVQGGELSMFINRFETNEPVLDAEVEVESGEVKARAKFHSDMGDYAVDDPALLNALAAQGQHPLIITIVAGAESDLLDGTIVVAARDHAHDDDHEDWSSSKAGILAGGVLVAVAIGSLALRRRKKDSCGTATKGGTA
jgi:hypothetical protein